MQTERYLDERGTECVHANTTLRPQSFSMPGNHCHSCYELYYVESGECCFLIEDNIHDLHAGDFILVPPMVLHYTRYPTSSCRRTVIFFRPEDVDSDVRAYMPDSEHFFEVTQIFQVPAAYREHISGCLKQMLNEEKINDARSELLRKFYLQGLLLLCSRVCLFLQNMPAQIHTTDQQILEAAQYICGHYMDMITTQDVAQAVGFSPNYLSRKFRQMTGIGLHEYLVFIRLHHAAQELLSTSDSITTIAIRCGFSDSNYFKDSFKKKYGVTPRNYRKMT